MDLYHQLHLTLDLLGIFFFAITGTLLAVQKKLDIIGSLALGTITGLGGGIIRDIIINITPAAFTNPWYLLPPLLASITTYFAYKHLSNYQNIITICDAIGLGIFCITGTTKALNHNLNPTSAILLGVTTAVGGGIIRDIMANKIPNIFKPNELYTLPALLGATTTTILWQTNNLNLTTTTIAFILTFTFRIIAWKKQWKIFLSYKQNPPNPPKPKLPKPKTTD